MSSVQFATFFLGSDLFGVHILRVREVLKNVTYSAVPGSNESVEGLMNLRGQIVTLIDLGKRVDAASESERTTCIIIKTDDDLERQGLLDHVEDRVGADPVGFLVDSVGEVITVSEDDIRSPPAHERDGERAVVKSVVTLESQLMTELSVERLLDL